MKQALLKLLELIGYVMFFALLLCALPLILIFAIFAGTSSLCEKFWAWRRHDPHADIRIAELEGLSDPQESTVEAYTSTFADICEMLQTYTGARLGKLKITGADDVDDLTHADGPADITLQRTILTDSAKVRLTLNLQTRVLPSGARIVYAVDSSVGDDDWHAPILPVDIKIIRPFIQGFTKFTLHASDDVWLLISLLRDDLKFTRLSRQPWAFVREHKVWLVRYQDGYSYGLRNKFSRRLARRFGRDIRDDEKYCNLTWL